MADGDMTTRKLFRGTATGRAINFGLQGDSGGRSADPAKGERQLGPFILPPFQRPPAWTREQQVRFVESIWLGLPLPAYVYNMCDGRDGYDADMWLLDGQQRWTAIHAYVAGEFEVFGSAYPDLSVVEQRDFRGTNFAAVETRTNDVALLREIYDRLAYGGTPHEPLADDEPSAPGP